MRDQSVYTPCKGIPVCSHSFGLTEKSNLHPKQLSGGQKQPVAIARALINQPSFIFADGATGALDKKTGQEILGILQRLNLHGHTIIQVTHSRENANYSKRIMHLVDGVIVKDEQVERPTIGPTMEKEADKDLYLSRMWMVAEASKNRSESEYQQLLVMFSNSKTRPALPHAVRSLSNWDRAESIDILRKVFSHEDWILRAEVLRNARKLGNAFGLATARQGLSDVNPWVRHLAILEWKTICKGVFSSDDIDLVLKHVADPDERVRASVVRMLPALKKMDSINLLIAALRDRDGRVRANALESLTEINPPQSILPEDFRNFLQDPNNRVRANAAVLVGKFNEIDGTECLWRMLNDESNMMRASGAWGLGVLKSERAKDMLTQKLAEEKQESVILQIVKSLANYDDFTFTKISSSDSIEKKSA